VDRFLENFSCKDVFPLLDFLNIVCSSLIKKMELVMEKFGIADTRNFVVLGMAHAVKQHWLTQ